MTYPYGFAGRIFLGLLLFAPAVVASRVGDTYAQLIAEKGDPKSQIQAGVVRILSYPDATIKLRDDIIVSIKVVAPEAAAPPAAPAKAPSEAEQITALKRKMIVALNQVNLIINQPVPSVPITPDIEKKVVRWGDIWFHPGATVPDFNTVDIRTTQETANYAPYEFITSNLNPGVAFLGSEVEFNAMTKFFYQDRSLPKKKLTEEEMAKINSLYRTIGTCETQLRLYGAQATLPGQ
jgi:hypothetical protein